MTEASNVPDGLVIEGRYRIVRRIAEGGMATVYQATDERLDRTVAIKIMHTQLAQGPHREQFVERFRREAKSAAAIANPHIVQVYDTGEYNGLDYLVMEYVHGVNLRHEMNTQRTFTVRETLRILSETLDGLSAAHRIGVVHRDIKPENILLNDRGRVQITDFGLAKAASQATLSTTNMLLGTAAYLAPEMIEHNQATPQGDLYSVGITAWEMLAGFVPFQSDNPVTLVFKHVHEDVPSVADPCPGIDPSIAAFIAHLTARAVDARPADAVEAMRELRELTAHLPMTAWQYRKPTVAPAPAATTALPPLPPVAADPTAPTSADASAHVDTPVTADAPSVVTAAIQAQQTTAMSQPPAAPADGTATAAFAPDATQAIDRSPEPATSIIDVCPQSARRHRPSPSRMRLTRRPPSSPPRRSSAPSIRRRQRRMRHPPRTNSRRPAHHAAGPSSSSSSSCSSSPPSVAADSPGGISAAPAAIGHSPSRTTSPARRGGTAPSPTPIGTITAARSPLRTFRTPPPRTSAIRLTRGTSSRSI